MFSLEILTTNTFTWELAKSLFVDRLMYIIALDEIKISNLLQATLAVLQKHLA